MKVTDEMVTSYVRAAEKRVSCGARDCRECAHALLTDTLADVPEPLSAAERAALFVHDRDKDRIEAQHRRIAELEAFLAQTTELVCASGQYDDRIDELRRLLVGECSRCTDGAVVKRDGALFCHLHED